MTDQDFSQDHADVDFSDKSGNSNEGDFDVGNTTQDNNPDIVFEHNGRKYTKDDLAKKLEHGDGFIEQLKQERAEDRKLLNEVSDKLKQQVDLKELLEHVKGGETVEYKEPPVFDKDSVVSDVLEKLSRKEESKNEQTNWENVTQTLTGKYGEHVNREVGRVAKENGLSLQEAASLARTKPKLFLSLFGNSVEEKKSTILSGSNSESVSASTKEQPSSLVGARTDKERIKVYMDRLNQLSN